MPDECQPGKSQQAFSGEDEHRSLSIELADLKHQLANKREAAFDVTFYDATQDVTPISSRVASRIKRGHRLKGHFSKVTSLQWSNDDRLVLTAGQDGCLLVWDPLSRKKLNMVELDCNWVMTCAFVGQSITSSGGSEDNSQLIVVSGGLDNAVSLHTLHSSEHVSTAKSATRKLIDHQGFVSCIKAVGEGRLLSSSADTSCALWDIERGERHNPIARFLGHSGEVISVAVSSQQPDLFLSSSSDQSCRMWDLRTGRACRIYEGHRSDVNQVVYFPQNTYAFGSASDDGNCFLWDLRADQQIAVYSDDSQELAFCATCLDFSKSGRLIFVGYESCNVLVWDLLVEQCVARLARHEGKVSCLEVAHNGEALLTGSWDKTCQFWTVS